MVVPGVQHFSKMQSNNNNGNNNNNDNDNKSGHVSPPRSTIASGVTARRSKRR